MVNFGTLICPFSTKSLLRLHGFLLTWLFFQSLKNPRKQRTLCICFKNYKDCGYTCNPRKFEIPALRFPHKDPVNPCKLLQCIRVWYKYTVIRHLYISTLYLRAQIKSYSILSTFKKKWLVSNKIISWEVWKNASLHCDKRMTVFKLKIERQAHAMKVD